MSARRSHFMRVTKKGVIILPPHNENPKLNMIAEFLNHKMKIELETLDEVRLSFMESRAPCPWCTKMSLAGLDTCLYCLRPFKIEEDES